MKNTDKVATPDQEFALALQFLGKVHVGEYSSEAVQNAKDNPDHLIWAMLEMALRPVKASQEASGDFSAVLSVWQMFYKEHFNMDVDLSGLKIPAKRPGFDRLLIVVRGLTINKVYDACVKRFSCWRYVDDLDANVSKNDRDPNRDGTYAVWVRDEVEADKKLKNLSADMLTEQEIKGITLLERVLFELKYFVETKKHLDIDNVTLCSGSRHSDGGVPSADWLDDGFEVLYCLPNDRDPGLRSREAVSL